MRLVDASEYLPLLKRRPGISTWKVALQGEALIGVNRLFRGVNRLFRGVVSEALSFVLCIRVSYSVH